MAVLAAGAALEAVVQVGATGAISGCSKPLLTGAALPPAATGRAVVTGTAGNTIAEAAMPSTGCPVAVFRSCAPAGSAHAMHAASQTTIAALGNTFGQTILSS